MIDELSDIFDNDRRLGTKKPDGNLQKNISFEKNTIPLDQAELSGKTFMEFV